MFLILDRLPNCRNIIRQENCTCNKTDIKKLKDFLKDKGLGKNDLDEIAQVIKVKNERLLSLYDLGGYLTISAMSNITNYLESHRIPGHTISFLQEQCGEAGIPNYVPLFRNL